MTAPSRRAVLTGALTIAFSLSGAAQAAPEGLPTDLARTPGLDSWLRLSADGEVTLLVGKVELGQGVLTAFAQLCADELDVAFSRITVVSGDTALCPNQSITAGSMSIPDGGAAVRAAAAEVRMLLLNEAARALATPVERLAVEDGAVSGGGRRTTYWRLIGDRRMERQARGVPVRSYRRRREVGRSAPRIDLPAKITGRPVFIQDLRPDGLLHARVVRPPTREARLESADEAAAVRAGAARVLRNGSFLAVVAEREWTAIKAARALAETCRWSDAPIPVAPPQAWLSSAPSRATRIKDQAPAPHARAARHLEAEYGRGYVMHASIAPSCALALFQDGRLTIDTHSQSVFETGAAIAELVGLPKDRVRMRHAQAAGCYGHNGADDAAAEAALIAMAVPGRPVRLQWMRDEEHRFEPYGSPMAQRLRAGLDADGDVLDWSMDLWSGSHSSRPMGAPGWFLVSQQLDDPLPLPPVRNPGPPHYGADRNAIPGYAFPGQSITTHLVTDAPVRTSSLRALGAHGNVFAIESFMDELAAAVGADPLDYRLRHLADPRARAVLQRAAADFGWRAWRGAPGRGRGLAYARYKNYAAYCAVCLEVVQSSEREPIRLVRAVIAADAGQTVNPDGLANQLEGGLLQALSWSLMEDVSFADGAVASLDWASYPILRFSEAPQVQTVIVDRPEEPSLGAGECAAGPAAAALANALADASGERRRVLPLISTA